MYDKIGEMAATIFELINSGEIWLENGMICATYEALVVLSMAHRIPIDDTSYIINLMIKRASLW